ARGGAGGPLPDALRAALLDDRDPAMSARAPAVVLFSGGLDSSTCLALAREGGFAPQALAVRYGQRHSFELRAAERVAQAMQVPLRAVDGARAALGGAARPPPLGG